MEEKTLTYVLLFAIFVLGMMIYCMCSKRSKSSFGAEEPVLEDPVFIFFAPWCGHCKAAKEEFEKAAEMNEMIILVDSTEPENKDLIEKYEVKGYPTIMKASGEKFIGARTAEAIDEFQKK